ncbi:hypothetical protein DPM33_31935 [Mesorhizobium hawassense]|uniref:Uncharacterized protein n=1 Tax=Mesorhizobium hawassense TaxID=1209954 RepID=A0A330H700_9HYPH|nr:hypothetical protein DPM33_31935 [Mesorhizobium hawassense]
MGALLDFSPRDHRASAFRRHAGCKEGMFQDGLRKVSGCFSLVPRPHDVGERWLGEAETERGNGANLDWER